VISTDTTRTTIDRIVDRGRTLGTSGRVAVCTAMPIAQDKSVDYGTTAELRASSFVGGHVWLRPAALDVLVTTAPGILAWSPPT
jgi:hypothetical protein